MHQRERVHHHREDIFRKRSVVLHPVLEQRTQQIGVLGGEAEIGVGKPVQLAQRIVGRNRLEPRGQGVNGLPVHGQDQAVEVAELIIDTADGAAGGLGDITNLE